MRHWNPAESGQWDIQEAGARLAAEVPFETAQELFSRLTGFSLSDHTTHEVVGEVGRGLGVLEVSPTAEEIVRRVATVAQGKKQPPIIVLAIHGAHVPTRPREAKGPGKGRKKQRFRRARWQGAAARLPLESLPVYAPESNPDAGICRYPKRVEPRNVCCQDLLHLLVEITMAAKRLLSLM